MTLYTLGSLTADIALSHTDLLAARTAEALRAFPEAAGVGAAAVDPEHSDTSASRDAYGLEPDTLVNCVIVSGKREGQQRVAACLVKATQRADVNNVVKRALDVRKASFLAQERAVQLSAMEYGGITPIGLYQHEPGDMRIFVDPAILQTPLVLIGSGIRRGKLILPGELLAEFPGVEICEDLGLPLALDASLPVDW
ncbi:YbaK/EbsC family protein [Psychromicrobium xiongbiense]|uniref:YbaK/EbsC family protein n=1 Tax=Psychromicrobium xiongbiense TaxID=3051184 RepID=UPI00255335A0|nr:YbaK/EbsC family protein [Psychromicrobium sp. YIM S02556]